MKKNQTGKKMLLRKDIFMYIFFAITLFSVVIFSVRADDTTTTTKKKVMVNDFLYSDYDWDEFKQKNSKFWDSACDDSDDPDCAVKTLNAAKGFYDKMYKLLAAYEANKVLKPSEEVYHVLDDLIIVTAFHEMTPSQFSDSGDEYANTYSIANDGGYNLDLNDTDETIAKAANDDWNGQDETFATYYEKETDTVKVLVKNLIAYTTKCYGVYGDPTKHTTDNNETYYTCDNGGELYDVDGNNKCADQIQSENKLGFWEFFVSKAEHDKSTGWFGKITTVLFLGQTVEDQYYDACMAYNSEYSGGAEYLYDDEPKVSTDLFFDFLSYNRYFDIKAHLQYHFKEILEQEDVDCMTSEVCDNSLEAKGVYDNYKEDLIEIRRGMIKDIIYILQNYGFDIDYDPVSTNAFNEAQSDEAARNSYYWPIGSDETEERNGVTYADGDPASTEVVANFGQMEDPISHEVVDHKGIDIKGEDGVTNVIAVYQGEVYAVVNNCPTDGSDIECNEKYGNEVILSHANGDYTVYAHLSSVDPAIEVGATVNKGQLIGKVGKSGWTNEAILHYELRKGGMGIENAVDPLTSTSIENPRPAVATGDFSVHETSLTKEEFVSKLKSYCATHSCGATFTNVFVVNAESVYDSSISNNVNPELVVVRGAKEGMSPGGSSNNYWGIGCYNGAGVEACHKYGTLSQGIAGFAGAVKNYSTVTEMMSKYAYIGAVWYNPGSWSLGGCVYYPYISQYMSESRSKTVANICNNGPSCGSSKGSGCTATTQEDQNAYASYNASGMVNMRYNIFGL